MPFSCNKTQWRNRLATNVVKTLAIALGVYGHHVNAAESVPATNKVAPTLTCPVPTFTIAKPKWQTRAENDVEINAINTNIIRNERAVFSGDVVFSSKNQNILAQELEYNSITSSFKASGDVQFQGKGVNIFANGLAADESNQQTSLTGASYQLENNPGHGAAGKIEITKNGDLRLIDSHFTTCYGETPDWQLVAKEIKISTKDNIGEAYHARFEILDVPVFYLPYFNFPVTDKRKSGFLYPSISSSDRLGVTIGTPYYWDIASNMDATITPRLMTKRGLQLLTEFRYLKDEQQGAVQLEYLNSDHDAPTLNNRYLANITHTGTFAENYRAHVNATTISDDSYLVDIGSELHNSNDAYIYQVGELAYFAESWNVTGKIQDFEILGDHLSSYKTLPQIEFNSHTPLGWLKSRFDVNAELAHFEKNGTDQQAQRYHVEAGFSLPITTPAWFLNSEFKVLQTHYQQNNIDDNPVLEASVNRTLPKLRLHGGFNFDRDLTTSGYTQTLEPQLQYLYIPNKDQSMIDLYDSAPLQDDYAGLFRDKRYSGLDRIAEANQYSWGVTSRILDPSNDELFRFSLGRIVYLNDDSTLTDEQLLTPQSQSALAAETFFKINKQWQVSGNIQYNTEDNVTNKSQLSLDYQRENYLTAQLNHRYIRNVSGVALEQISLLSSVAINEQWQVVGRVSRDLQQKRSIESYAGVQYESCCWAVRLAYHRHIESSVENGQLNYNNLGEFNSGFMVQFVIKGLNGQTSALNSQDMLNTSIFGYKQPYFQNN